MGGEDFRELIKPLQPEQNHESVVQFRPGRGGGVSWRFVQSQMEAEERCEEIVLELSCCSRGRGRDRVRRHEIQECLLWVQAGRDKEAGVNLFPGGQLKTASAAVL